MGIKKISIHGLPRSGTSWLGEIVNSSEEVAYRYQPLFSYAYKDYLSEHSSGEVIDSFFDELLHTDDSFVLRTQEREEGKCPVFQKGKIRAVAYKEVRYHQILPALLNNSPDVQFVFLIRNPLAVINSWLSAPREFRADLGWGRLEEWRYAEKKNLNRAEEFNGYERWKYATRLFLELREQCQHRVYLVNYDLLVSDAVSEARRMFDFLGLEFGEQTSQFLQSENHVEDHDPYSVNRKSNKPDKWKDDLEFEIRQFIEADLSDTELEFLLRE